LVGAVKILYILIVSPWYNEFMILCQSQGRYSNIELGKPLGKPPGKTLRRPFLTG